MLLEAIKGMIALFLRVEEAACFPPPLSYEEEQECFQRMKQGDGEAREKLILHNLRLVAHIVKKYYITSRSQEDLISIGTIGLIKAVDSFDASNGARFATYAGRCLHNEILMHFRSQRKTRCEVSLNEPIDVDKDGNPLTYIDIISVDDTIAEDIYVKISSAQAKKFIKSGLEPRERQIVVLRYGLSGKAPLAQREIAAKLGISRSYVSRRRYCKRRSTAPHSRTTAVQIEDKIYLGLCPKPCLGNFFAKSSLKTFKNSQKLF